MTNKEYISALAKKTGYSNEVTQRMLTSLVGSMGDIFLEGNTITVPNFGAFEVKKNNERIIMSPKTGQRMLVPPKLSLAFKPNADWKDRLKNGGDE